jgi:hypothetical protein
MIDLKVPYNKTNVTVNPDNLYKLPNYFGKKEKIMGGTGSGTWTRWPTKPLVESALTLDLNQLIRDGALHPGRIVSGTLTWTRSGQQIASIGYEVDLTKSTSGSMRLHYNANDIPVDYRVPLATTRPHFGGVRWWFICPLTGCRAYKLQLPSGSDKFASRQAFSLAYGTQNEAPRHRQLSKAQEIRRRLGGSGSLFDPFPDKPKGMHWTTFLRLQETSERAANTSLAAMARRLRIAS